MDQSPPLPCSWTPSLSGGWSLRCHLPSCGRNGGVEDRGHGVVSGLCQGDTRQATPRRVTPPGARLPPAGDEGMCCSFPAFSWLRGGGPRQILLGLDWFLVSRLPSVSVTRRARGQPSRPTCLCSRQGSGQAVEPSSGCPPTSPGPSPSVCLRLINTRLPPGQAGPPGDEEDKSVFLRMYPGRAFLPQDSAWLCYPGRTKPQLPTALAVVADQG